MTYYKFRDLVTKHMSKYHLYEVGLVEKPPHYDIFKMFNPHAYNGRYGKNDTWDIDSNGKHSDDKIIERLL